MNNELEKELKELQIQYDKVLKERNELSRENRLLKKDLEEYQEFVKKGVEEHYKEFMSDYDVMLEEYEEIYKNYNKDLEVLEILKNKTVAIFLIPNCQSAYDYSMKTIGFKSLTDKEFMLIKEWLENGIR